MWVFNNSLVNQEEGRLAMPGRYPRANWKELTVDLPNIRFEKNEDLATSSSTPAFVFSLDSFSKTVLNTPLLRSTRPFLCDDLAGRSFTWIPCPFRYFVKNGRQSSGTALKYSGAPWRHSHDYWNMENID